MYYSFPNKYYVQVTTSEDFEYNHKGNIIDWNSNERKPTNPIKNEEIQKIMDSISKNNIDTSKILEEADEEYASEEVANK